MSVLKINFYPDHDDPRLEEYAKKFQRFWENEGGAIVSVLEKHAGFTFLEDEINA